MGLGRSDTNKFASFVTGSRTKWLVIAMWAVALVVVAPLGSKLADVTKNDTASSLPASAESTRVIEALEEDFAAGETSQGLIVYQRDGGLTAADRATIRSDAKRLEALPEHELPLTAPPVTPFTKGASQQLVSANGDLAYTVLAVPSDDQLAAEWGANVRGVIGDGSPGMQVLLSGDLGFDTDSEQISGDVDSKLLLVTVSLVLVLLAGIYRAALVAITPLIVVFFAYSIAQGLIYLFAESGASVSESSTSILIVLMFGVGTDYCLLLVSRYREELRRVEDKHQAMARALTRSGPTILASGLTVALAMTVLVVADTRFTASLGPVSAIGIVSVMVGGLTLLPALLTIFGRVGFWPRRSDVAYGQAVNGAARPGLWRRFADRVLGRPGLALSLSLIVLVAGATGLAAYKVDYSTTAAFKKTVDSVEGFQLLEQAFTPGVLAPTTVIVERADGSVTDADAAAAARQIRSVAGVASVSATGLHSSDRTATTLDVVLEDDPYTTSAVAVIPRMRDALATLPAGVTAAVGGGTAIQEDFDHAISADFRVIAPLVLLVIGIILAILLRALVAPLVLIASVIISLLATIGLSMLFFRFVVGDSGINASLPTFAFIFLVALGIDYTIFLMARVREEARELGTREGMLRALDATGSVITSAGVILAGTFAVLMTMPDTFTFDLGFMVAFGILLDTFLVRTIMVPAAVELLGDRIWWPSTAGDFAESDMGSESARPAAIGT